MHTKQSLAFVVGLFVLAVRLGAQIPTIGTPPASQAAWSGSNVAFTVAASGAAPLTYRWYRDGQVLVNGGRVAGVDTSALNLSAAVFGDAGYYHAVVANGSGAVASTAAALSVLTPPWLDGDVGVAAKPGLGAINGTTVLVKDTGGEIGAAADAFHFVYAPVTGNVEIVVRLASLDNTQTNAKAGVMIRETLAAGAKCALILATPTNGTRFLRRTTTDGAAVSSATNDGILVPGWLKLTRKGNTLSAASSADGGTWISLGSDTVTLASNVFIGYAVASRDATRTCAAVFETTLLYPFVPPTVTAQPVGRTNWAETSAAFAVSATGAPPMFYQWRKNGAAVGGATNRTLLLDNVQTTDAGNYDVVITNAAGSVTSQVAVLAVNVPATLTWTGSVSSDWNNPTNWSPQQVPTATNKVVINTGSVSADANSRFAVLTFSGAARAYGSLRVRSETVLNWSGQNCSDWSCTASFAQGTSLVVESNGLVNLLGPWMFLGGGMTNYGRVVHKDGYFRLMNDNATWRGLIENFGVWEMQGDLTLDEYWNNDYGFFENFGVYRKTAGTGSGTFNLLCKNEYGTVEAQSGTILFNHSQRLDGLYVARTGAALQFNSGTFDYTTKTRLTGPGQYYLTGSATLQGLLDYLPNLQLQGGTVVLSPSFQTNGTIDRLDVAGSSLSGNYRVTGVLNLNGASRVYGAMVISSNAVLNWSGQNCSDWSCTASFAQGSSLVVESNALVNLLGPWMFLGGGMTNYGRVVHKGGYFRLMNDNSSWRGWVENLGVWDMQGDVTLDEYWNNNLAAFDNLAVYRKTAGSGSGTVSLLFKNERGTLEAQSGTVLFNHGQRLDGLYVAGPGAAFQFNSGTFDYTLWTRLSGAGQYYLTGSATLQGLLDYLPNLQLIGGTIILSPHYQTNGAIGRLDLNGSSLSGSYRVSGVLNLNVASRVYGSVAVGANAVLNWSGQNCSDWSCTASFATGSSLVVESNGLVNLLGPWMFLGGGLTNYGRVVHQGGYFRLMNDASGWQGGIENMPGGVWEIGGDLTTDQYWANDYAYFRNRGLLRRALGTGSATVGVMFYNQGQIEQLSGSLNFGRDFTLTDGTVLFGLGSTDYGRINLAGTATLAGRLAVSLLEAFIPPTNTSYPVMTWGVAAGAFTNTDGLNIGFGRYLTPTYTAGGLTLQTWGTNRPNTTPNWLAIPNVTVPEGLPFLYTNQVTDAEGNQVLFKLVSAPAGAAVGLSNGVFSWTPTEAQGPSSNYITLRLEDNGSPSLMATQSFFIWVTESNSAPVLPHLAPQIIGVGGPMSISSAATDTDLPANNLTYSLPAAPGGMTINASGLISWTPSAAQAFQTFFVTVRVVDNGVPARSDTNTFEVRVMPRPVPPVGLVSWWSGDGTTSDNLGVNDGILSGVASYAPGLYGSQSFSFEGGFLSVMHSASLSFPSTNGLTVEMWVKRSQTGFPVYYFGKQVGCGDYNYRSPSDYYSAQTFFDVPVGQWTHLAWVFDGQEMFGYVNGVFSARLKMTLGAPNLAPLFIGGTGTCGNSYRGSMDEVRLYNRALGAAEVASVFNGFPAFCWQPTNQAVFAGTPVALVASASGGEPLSLQWYFNGSPLPGATAPTLALTNAQPANAGAYALVVSNAYGALTSSVASLVVYPGIVQHPVNQSVAPGATASFSVAVAGTPSPLYQWYKNGLPLSNGGNVSGATASTLVLANVATADAGSYRAVVSYAGGSGTSRPATLSVVWPPWANQDLGAVVTPGLAVMSNGLFLVAGSGDEIGNQADAGQFLYTNFSGNVEIIARVWSLENTHPNAKAAVMIRENLSPGSRQVLLALTPNGTQFISRDTPNVLPAMTFGGDVWQSPVWLKLTRRGSAFSAAKSTDGVTWQTVATSTVAMPAGTLAGLAVTSRDTNYAGLAVFDAVEVYPYEAPPQIVTQPQGRVSPAGTTVEFKVLAARTAPLYYQWRLNGTPLAGATQTNLILSNLQPPDAGAYTVVITNAAGAVTSQLAQLVVNSPITWNGAVSSDWLNKTNWTPQQVPTAADVVNLNSGSITLSTNSKFAILNLNGTARVYGAMVVRSNAVLNWSGQNCGDWSCTASFAPGSSLWVESNGLVNLLGPWMFLGGGLTNYGRVVHQGGTLRLMNDNSSWRGLIENFGLWEMQGDVTLDENWNNDYGYFDNLGTFRKTAGTGSGYLNVLCKNEFGTLESQSGTVLFNHSQRLDGLYVAGPGAAIQFNSGTFDYTVKTRLTGAGQYYLTGSATLQGLLDYLPNLQLAGGTVVLSSTFQTNGTIGRLDLAGSSLSGNYRVTGVLNLGGASRVYGAMVISSNAVLNWSGQNCSDWSCTASFAQGASLLVESNALVNLLGPWMFLGGGMTNYGRVVHQGGYFRLMNDGSSWRGLVENFGVWEMQGDLTLDEYWNNDSGYFENFGLLRKTTGSGSGTVNVLVKNEFGTFEALSGTVLFNHGQRLDGLYVAGPGAAFQFNSGTFDYTLKTRLTGAGQYSLTGSATLLGLLDFLPNLQLNGGTVVLSPTYQTNGSIARLDLNGSALSGSYQVTGLLSLGGASRIYGAMVIRSNAVLNWSGQNCSDWSCTASFAQGSSLVIESNALVNLLGPWMFLGGGMTNYGRVVHRGGYFRLMNDNSSWRAVVENFGLWEMQGDVTLDEYWNNDYGFFENVGVFRKTAGSGSGTVSVLLKNEYGTLEAQSGTVLFNHSQRLDGLYLAGPGAACQFNSGTFDYTLKTRLTGAGPYSLTGSATLQGLLDYLPNLQLVGGTLILSPNYQTNGTIARLDLNGSALSGNYRVSGVLNLAAASRIYGALVIGPDAVLNWSGQNCSDWSCTASFAQGSSLVVERQGLVNLLGPWMFLGGGLTNSGRVVHQAGYLRLMNDASGWRGGIENLAGGVWEIGGDLTIDQYWSNDYAFFRNRGRLRRATGTGTATVGVMFYNQGQIEQLSGSLNFGRNFTLTDGTVLFGLGAGDYGRINLVGTATLAGRLAVHLLDAFIPPTNASYPIMTWGVTAGTFTNYDGLNLGFGRYLTPTYSAGGLTLQTWGTNRANTLPTWTTVPNFTIPEGVPFFYTNLVSDAEGDLVLFKLVTAPAGATLGLSNGLFSWTPSETQGPSSNYITLRLEDSGSPSLMATQSFIVWVTETNSAPIPPKLGLQLIGVNGLLRVNCAATDLDVPTNLFNYSFLQRPQGMTVDTTGLVSWTPAKPGTYDVKVLVVDNGTPPLRATNSFSVSVLPVPIVPPGLVSWWTGDGTTADQSGLNDGILAGDASYAPGFYGSQAFQFNGGYLSALHSPTLSFNPTNPITVEMWVNRSQSGYPVYYFGKQVGCSAYNYRSPSDLYSGGSYLDLPVGEWHHLAWVFTGLELLGYVDGVLEGRVITSLGAENLAPLFLGAAGTCGNSFRGRMDEVRLYNRALSPAEVTALYSGNSFGPPLLESQPASLTLILGGTGAFQAVAHGASPLAYQWRFNGQSLPGETTSTLSLAAVTLANEGAYDLVVTNAFGAVTSQVAALSVWLPPVITTQPLGKSLVVGDNHTMTVTATGIPTPSYLWLKNGVPLSGTTSPTLTLNSVSPSDAADYSVWVYSLSGAATSSVAHVTVATPIIWTGAVSTDYHTAGNWNPARVPTDTDGVIINSGSVTFTPNSRFAVLFLNGTARAYGPVVVRPNTVLNWNGQNCSDWSCSASLAPGSSLLVQSNGLVNLLGPWMFLGGGFTNYGRVVHQGGYFRLMNDGSTWRGLVENFGIWDMQGDLTLDENWNNDSGYFENFGLYRKSAGSGSGTVNVLFKNEHGTLQAQSGTILFNHSQRLDGLYVADAGAAFQFNSGTFDYTLQTRLTGPGQYYLTGSATLQGLLDYLPNLHLQGGTVVLSPNYQTNGTIGRLDLSGSSLSGNYRVSGLFNLDVSSRVYGAIVISSNAVLNWSGQNCSDWSCTASFAQGSSLVVESNGLVNLLGPWMFLGGGMTNYGRVVHKGGYFRLMNDASTWRGVVENFGLWEMQGDVTLDEYWNNDSGYFENWSVYRKTAGSGSGTVNIRFKNERGTLEAQSGTILFNHGQRLDGLYVAGPGASFQFNSGTFDYTTLSRFTGPGQYYLTGSATLQGLLDYLPNLQLQGGTVILSPSYQTNGAIGRLDLTGSSLSGNYRVAGVFNLSAASRVYGAVVISSNAVLNWSGQNCSDWSCTASFVQGSSLVVESNGLVNLLGPWMFLGGEMTNYGRVVHTGGYFRLLNDNSSWQGLVENFGLWEMQGDVTVDEYWNNAAAYLENRGVYRKTAGSGTGSLNVFCTNEFGTLEVQTGTLLFNHGQRLDGLYVAGPGAALQFNTGTFDYTPKTRFTGTGQYYLTGSALLQGLLDYLPNLQLQGGTVSLSPNYQITGAIQRLDINGSTLAGTNWVTGVLNLGGNSTGPLTVLPGGVVNWSRGAAYGPIVVGSNAVLNWSGQNCSDWSCTASVAQGASLVVETNGLVNLLGPWMFLGGGLTNSGRVVHQGGYFRLMNDAASWRGGIINRPSGVWEIQGDLSLEQYWANDYAYFGNAGLLRRAVGTGVATVGVMYYNQGQIEQVSGSLNFGRNFSLTDGTVTFGIGDADYGRINLIGTATLAGRLAVSFRDGYIPPTNVSYQVMTWGVTAGTFTNYDGLNVGFGRYLTPVYAANGLTLQTWGTNRANTVPTWTALPNFTVFEGVPFRYTNSVSDAQGDGVLFKLISGPGGLSLGLSNGVFSWTPTETQGPSSNYVTARLLDTGSPSLMATQSFIIWVTESNAAPVLPTIPPQVLGIHGVLAVNSTATDSDLPTNTLTYTLLSAPAGVGLTNGLVSWSPTNPGTYQITLKVTDNGVPPLSATNTFSVRVLDKPTPPAGLVSWWTGDGTTADEMGWHDGVLSGAAGYTAGYYGSQALNFDGGWMIVSNAPLLSFSPTNSMTMEMWVKRTQPGFPVYFFGKQENCGSYNYRSPSDYFSAGTLLDPPVGEWRHYAWVYDTTNLEMYVNGLLTYRIETTLGPENLSDLLIGSSGSCGQPFRGAVDEVRLYNRALNSNDVWNVYVGLNTGALYFKRHPRHQTMMLGGSVTFTNLVVGAAPLAYQWRFKGLPLANATNASLTLSNVQLTDGGDYTVVVSNPINTITSQVATLTIRLAPVLPVIPPQLVGVGGLLSVNNAAASGAPAGVLLYNVESAPTGVTINSNGLVNWTPTAPQAPGVYQITCRVVDGQFPALSATNTFVVRALSKPSLPAGLVSWWTGDGTTADQQGLNDGILTGGANYTPGLYGQAFNFFGGWLSMLHSASLSFPPGSTMSLEMWVKRTTPGYPVSYFGKRVACGDWNYQFANDQFSAGSDYDSPVGEWRHFAWVFTGTEMFGYVNGVLTHRILASLGAENAAPLFVGASGCGNSLQGVVDEVRLYNRALTSNEIMAVYTGQSASAPIIVQEPASQTVGVTGTATLAAIAYGAPPLAYQWRKNGSAVSGATNATLVLTNVQTSQAGGYALVVTNTYGSVTSQVATLTVSLLTPVVIVSPPQSLTLTNGATALFTVTASGSFPTYQWRFNGAPLAGQTTPTLTLNHVTPSQAGYYDVVVTNTISAVTSAPPALLRVLVAPTIGGLAITGAGFTLAVPTENRLRYTILATDTLTPPVTWLPLTNTVGTGAPLIILDPVPAAPTRFYRILVE